MLQIKYIKSHCYYIFYGVICRRKGLTALLRSLDEKDMNYKHMTFRTQCGKSYERSQKCVVFLILAYLYKACMCPLYHFCSQNSSIMHSE